MVTLGRLRATDIDSAVRGRCVGRTAVRCRWLMSHDSRSSRTKSNSPSADDSLLWSDSPRPHSPISGDALTPLVQGHGHVVELGRARLGRPFGLRSTPAPGAIAGRSRRRRPVPPRRPGCCRVGGTSASAVVESVGRPWLPRRRRDRRKYLRRDLVGDVTKSPLARHGAMWRATSSPSRPSRCLPGFDLLSPLELGVEGVDEQRLEGDLVRGGADAGAFEHGPGNRTVVCAIGSRSRCFGRGGIFPPFAPSPRRPPVDCSWCGRILNVAPSQRRSSRCVLRCCGYHNFSLDTAAGGERWNLQSHIHMPGVLLWMVRSQSVWGWGRGAAGSARWQPGATARSRRGPEGVAAMAVVVPEAPSAGAVSSAARPGPVRRRRRPRCRAADAERRRRARRRPAGVRAGAALLATAGR